MNERKLVRFGVYLCPACGETDPEGLVLSAPASVVVEGLVAPPGADAPTFAAPPPAAWVPPGAPAPALEALGAGPPRVLVGTVSFLVVVELIGIAASRDPCSFALHAAEIGFLLAVLSGATWARTMGLFSAMLGVLVAIFALAIAARAPDPRLVTVLRVYGGITLVSDAFWIYVLMRGDVTSYFVRNARRA